MGCVPRLRRHLYIGLFIPAVLFFFNPNIAIVDLLPDTIGYFLLFAALFYLADLNPHLDEARRGFLRMALIDLCRLPVFMLLLSLPNKEQPEAQLLATFVFAVLEMIYALPAWRHFFEGISSVILGSGDLSRYDLPGRRSLVRSVGRNGRVRLRLGERGPARSMPDVLKTATVWLIIMRNLLAVLPEATSLSSFEAEGYVTNFDRDIYEFRRLFVVLAFLVMAIIGIVWLVRALRLMIRIKRDTGLAEALSVRWEREVMPRENMFLCRRIKHGYFLLTFAFLLSIDLYVDNLNFIPDFLAAIVLVWALLTLRRCAKNWQLPLVFSVLWGLVSLGSAFVSGHFFEHYYIDYIYRSTEAYTQYAVMVWATTVEQLFFIAAVGLTIAMLWNMIRQYMRDGGRESRALERDHLRSLVIMLVLAAVSTVSGVLYDYYLPSVEFIWCIDCACSIVFALYAWNALGETRESLCIAIGER
ncbi:MAG: hypothetical protein IKL84_01055 [Clostridia bacterium]|nr:hypothetical protein [Clostridia bacterium]